MKTKQAIKLNNLILDRRVGIRNSLFNPTINLVVNIGFVYASVKVSEYVYRLCNGC